MSRCGRWFIVAGIALFAGWPIGALVRARAESAHAGSTGSAGASAAAGGEAAVQLPPMIVADSSWKKPWRYATGSGLEVLSQCDDDVTRSLIERTSRLNALLGYLLPPELQFHTGAPRLTILVDASQAGSLSQNLVARLRGARTGAARPPETGSGGDHGRRARLAVLPNLQLEDVDLLAVFAIIDERSFDADGLTYARDHVLRLLQRRTPPLPPWFIVGFMAAFDDLHFGTSDLQLARFTWMSDAVTQQVRNEAEAPRVLMPLAEFFAYQPESGDPRLRLWGKQAALLLRWALDPAEPERRAALCRFVRAAAGRGVSEALLRECFGLGFADLRDRLSDFLPAAVKQTVRLRPPDLQRAPKVEVRDATPGEVARMKGEWERLEIRFVQPRYPEYAAQYLALARETLTVGLDRAPNDAGVLQARGLLESDLQDPKAARPFLEAAVLAGAVRPRVYLELAKFRLADALEDSDRGTLDLGKAQVVLEPLQRALAEAPPIGEAYGLVAEVWARSGAVLAPDQWRLLDDAMARFPGNLRLLLYTAALRADNGDAAAALALIDQGLGLHPPETTRALLVNLRAAIAAGQRKVVLRPADSR